MHELGDAKQTVHVQAYFFYIKSDRESMIDAEERGVKVVGS